MSNGFQMEMAGYGDFLERSQPMIKSSDTDNWHDTRHSDRRADIRRLAVEGSS